MPLRLLSVEDRKSIQKHLWLPVAEEEHWAISMAQSQSFSELCDEIMMYLVGANGEQVQGVLVSAEWGGCGKFEGLKCLQMIMKLGYPVNILVYSLIPRRRIPDTMFSTSSSPHWTFVDLLGGRDPYKIITQEIKKTVVKKNRFLEIIKTDAYKHNLVPEMKLLFQKINKIQSVQSCNNGEWEELQRFSKRLKDSFKTESVIAEWLEPLLFEIERHSMHDFPEKSFGLLKKILRPAMEK